MKKIYFTITGTKYLYGHDFFEPKMTVRLVKEPDNEYDSEAIRVEAEGLGKVGYVANSTYTVEGISWSAGRIYDKIGKTARATVMYKLPKNVLCYIDPDSLISEIPDDEDQDGKTRCYGCHRKNKGYNKYYDNDEADDSGLTIKF